MSNPKIEYLIKRKFPFLQGQPVNREVQALAAAFSLELHGKPIGEVDALFRAEQAREVATATAVAAFEESQRPFNQATARADFVYWSKQAFWTLEESIALSFSRDPKTVNLNSLRRYLGVSPFAMEYERLLSMARRFVATGELTESLYPEVFIAWCRKSEVLFPQELADRIAARGVVIKDMAYWKATALETAAKLDGESARCLELTTQLSTANSLAKSSTHPPDAQLESPVNLPPKTRQSLERMIIAMAMKRYDYTPRSKIRSGVPRAIVQDVEASGMRIDIDTVRERLREAEKELPSQWDALHKKW